MKNYRFINLFKGFYEQYTVSLVFMLLTPLIFINNPIESLLALGAIWLGTLADISINRVYDSDDDAIEEWKKKTNPVSNGDISKDSAWKICIIMYFLSIIFALLTGNMVFSLILAVRNLLGFQYSGPPIRAKSSPIVDLLFHPPVIDVGPALMAIIYTGNYTPLALYMLGFLVLNSLFTQITQEIRDLDIDRKAGLDTTANRLGGKYAMILQKSLLVAMGLFALGAGLVNGLPYLTGIAAIGIIYILKNIKGDDRRLHHTRRNILAVMTIGLLIQGVVFI